MKTVFQILFVLTIFSVTESFAGPQEEAITDSRDGRVYKTVKIGSQVWMAENLNYAAEGSTCPKNKSSNCKNYGRLYNVNSLDGLCPRHFRVPGKEDWLRLFSVLGIKEVCGNFGYEEEEVDACDYLNWKKAVKKLNDAGFNIKYAGEGYDIGESAHFVAKGLGSDDEVIFWADDEYASDYGGNGGQTGTYSIRCVEVKDEDDAINKVLKDVHDNATKLKGSVKTPSESDIKMSGGSSLSFEDIVKVLRRYTPGLRHIYKKSLKGNPQLNGTVTLKLSISSSGEVERIAVVSSTTGADDFDDEIKISMSRWKFFKVKSGRTTVVVPFTFFQEN